MRYICRKIVLICIFMEHIVIIGGGFAGINIAKKLD